MAEKSEMIEGNTFLAVIPARGGSKGIPGKNLREVRGKPLLAWTMDEAKKSRHIDRIILSSEDPEIMRVAEKWRVETPFVRPTALASDEATLPEVLLHAIGQVPGYDYVVLLQPTSPLRTAEDIDTCIEMCIKKKAKGCISVTEPDKSPYWMYKLDENDFISPLISSEHLTKRRQELPRVYVPNGAVYIAEIPFFLQTKSLVSESTIAYKMPKNRSLDIDTNLDLAILDVILKHRNG
jgi:N-acylneuraminate cytidylyltransferase